MSDSERISPRQAQAETAVVAGVLEEVITAANLTRCPLCEARSMALCPQGGTARATDCPAIQSGLAHLWVKLTKAGKTASAAGLIREETKS